MKSNKIKYYCYRDIPKSIFSVIFFISLIFLEGNFLNAEYLLEESDIDSSTKTDENNSGIPTNPFELVEMIRRQNSMNDATNPSDAIDDALKSFNSMEEK